MVSPDNLFPLPTPFLHNRFEEATSVRIVIFVGLDPDFPGNSARSFQPFGAQNVPRHTLTLFLNV